MEDRPHRTALDDPPGVHHVDAVGVSGHHPQVMGDEDVGDLTFSQTSLNGFGLLGLSFGPVGLFAKAGIAAWDAESKIGNLKTSVSGSDPVYGIGARVQIFKVSGRIEYEYYDQGDFDDVSMTSISLLYTF